MFARRLCFSPIILLASISACASLRASDPQVVRVSVRDSDFKMIGAFDDQRTMARFRELWLTKRVVAFPSTCKLPWAFKIDPEPGSRWLYHPAGYMMMLSYFEEPYFEIPAKEEFNDLLGLANRNISPLPAACVPDGRR